MLTLGLTVLILIVVYFLQQAHPLLAGMLAVAPVKIVATSFMVLEDGGVPRLQEAIAGMLVGQLVWSAALVVVWFALR
jgi:uncharacterized membrane protein (GlpM family)